MKRSKKIVALAMAALMTAGSGMTVSAGQWQSDTNGWWWQNDDGSYPVGSWQWLDGNNDGTAECYYFDGNGYMLANTITPDGYSVDGNGAWVVNGVIQTQTSSVQAQTGETQTGVYTDDYSGTYAVPYFEMDGSKTYHDVVITYDAGSNSILYNDTAAGYTATYTYFGTGLNGWTSFELVSAEEKSSIFFSAPGVMEAYGWDDFESVQRK